MMNWRWDQFACRRGQLAGRDGLNMAHESGIATSKLVPPTEALNELF